MAAARYVRVLGVSTYGGAFVEFTNFAFYNDTTQVGVGVTPVATLDPIATSRWALVPGLRFQWDFGAVETLNAFKITAIGRDGFPHTLALEYSVDGVVWTSGFVPVLAVAFPGDGGTTGLIYVDSPNTYPSSSFDAFDILKLSMDGPVGGTTFVDLSPSARTITVAAGAALSADHVTGSAALYRSTGGLTISGPSDFSFGTGDFTIEGWLKYVDSTVYFFGAASSATSTGYWLELTANGLGLHSYSPAFAVFAPLPPANTWFHFAFCRKNGTLTIYVNGKSAYQTSLTLAVDGGAGNTAAYIGSFNGTGGTAAYYLDSFRVTKAARYNGNFNLPDATFAPSSTLIARASLPLALTTAAPALMGFGQPPAFTVTPFTSGLVLDPDTGNGTISGTVKKLNTPDNIPLQRRVRLHDKLGMRLIRETWSDPVTGAFSFTNVQAGGRYVVIAYDHPHQYRAVIDDSVEVTV